MREDYYDDTRNAPPTVVAAVACGTAPTPFLAIYAVLFLVHGTVHPVVPPDITDSKNGELLAGIIATVIFAASVTALLWAINGRRRWTFAVVQAGMLGTSLWFLIDGTKGGTLASAAVLVTSAAALALIAVPPSAAFYRSSSRISYSQSTPRTGLSQLLRMSTAKTKRRLGRQA